MKAPILGKDELITRIGYDLLSGFGADGNPRYHTGEITDAAVLGQVKEEIDAFQERRRLYAAASLGRLLLGLAKGPPLEIQLVFDQRAGRYSGLVRIGAKQYLTNPSFTQWLEHCRGP